MESKRIWDSLSGPFDHSSMIELSVFLNQNRFYTSGYQKIYNYLFVPIAEKFKWSNHDGIWRIRGSTIRFWTVDANVLRMRFLFGFLLVFSTIPLLAEIIIKRRSKSLKSIKASIVRMRLCIYDARDLVMIFRIVGQDNAMQWESMLTLYPSSYRVYKSIYLLPQPSSNKVLNCHWSILLKNYGKYFYCQKISSNLLKNEFPVRWNGWNKKFLLLWTENIIFYSCHLIE